MGILGLFKKKLFVDTRYNHEITAEERYLGTETRQLNRRLKIEEQKLKIAEMQRDFELRRKEQELEMLDIENQIAELSDQEDDGDGMKKMLMEVFAPQIKNILTPKTQVGGDLGVDNVNNSSPHAETGSNTLRSLSNEKLIDMWNNTPMMAKQYVKNADDETVIVQLKKLLPSCDEDTYTRAFKIVRGLKE